VLTTGATASECARELLHAGAARVWVATPARAVGRDATPNLVSDLSRDAQIEAGCPTSAVVSRCGFTSNRPSLSVSPQAGVAQGSLPLRRDITSGGGYRVGWRPVRPARSEDYANGES
jgi:hypothetical protein